LRCGDYKTTYRADRAIFQTGVVKFWFILFTIFMLFLPFMAGRYAIYIVNLCGIAIIGAMGLNVLTGFAGQLSLGHAAFIAIGAYTTAILPRILPLSDFPLSLPLLIVASGSISALVGVMVAFPAIRLRGLYLALTTMAAYFVVRLSLLKGGSFTGAAGGLQVARAQLFGFVFRTDIHHYYLIFSVVFMCTLFTRNLVRTKIGRAWIAIRDRDIAAEAIGIDIVNYKLLAFAISSFYAGVCGSLFAFYVSYINPVNFEFSLSVQYISMIIMGGMGSVLGSIYGAVFMTFLPEFIRVLSSEFVGYSSPELSVTIALIQAGAFGLFIVLFLIFEPRGFYGIWRTIKVYFRFWPFSY
jgi:branched-chain amino acid transport system permease protein